MIGSILEALQFSFMRHALLAGLLVSIACGIVGTFVVIKRIVFVSGGIAHAAYGGIGLGYYVKFSLLPLAKNLKARLLLVHGMEDPNVLYQDTVRVYRELLKADKETLVELFLDPTGGHGLGGDVKRLGRMRKYEEFLTRNLGEGAPAEAEPAAVEESDDEADEAEGDFFLYVEPEFFYYGINFALCFLREKIYDYVRGVAINDF